MAVKIKKPEVIGMSCHSVIPMPHASGVRIMMNDAVEAFFFGITEYANLVME
jgi:hypothetical protein